MVTIEKLYFLTLFKKLINNIKAFYIFCTTNVVTFAYIATQLSYFVPEEDFSASPSFFELGLRLIDKPRSNKRNENDLEVVC